MLDTRRPEVLALPSQILEALTNREFSSLALKLSDGSNEWFEIQRKCMKSVGRLEASKLLDLTEVLVMRISPSILAVRK